jgi:hypothetical protein
MGGTGLLDASNCGRQALWVANPTGTGRGGLTKRAWRRARGAAVAREIDADASGSSDGRDEEGVGARHRWCWDWLFLGFSIRWRWPELFRVGYPIQKSHIINSLKIPSLLQKLQHSLQGDTFYFLKESTANTDSHQHSFLHKVWSTGLESGTRKGKRDPSSPHRPQNYLYIHIYGKLDCPTCPIASTAAVYRQVRISQFLVVQEVMLMLSNAAFSITLLLFSSHKRCASFSPKCLRLHNQEHFSWATSNVKNMYNP